MTRILPAATLVLLALLHAAAPAAGAEQILCPDDASAAQAGSPVDLYALGRAYDAGYCGRPVDKALAADWYRRAAEAGHTLAAYELGETFFTGDGLPTDFPAAKKWYLAAAGKGHGPAQLRLGFLYAEAHFEGLTPDYAQAEEWFRKAAAQDAGDARFRLGNFYNNYKEPRDHVQAAVWLKRAAEGGHRVAMFDLARLLQEGKGVARNDKLALEWMTKAAEADVLQAQMALSHIYAAGKEKDIALSLKWTLRIANKPTASPFWLNKAGDVFFEGWEAVPKNYPMARRFYDRAALKGDRHAAARLAEMHEQGLGVEKDPAAAARYRAMAGK